MKNKEFKFNFSDIEGENATQRTANIDGEGEGK